jgi:activator of 2-hydroxyglutaryl-CoA dehydratase
MCAVFAESEVISLVAKREKPENIGYGILESIAERLAAMAKGIHPEEKVVFTGGGALNPLLVKILGEKLHTTVYASKYPQLTGAFGAALAAMELVHAEIPRTRAA